MRKGYMASTRSPFVPSGKGKGEAPANAFATGGAETVDRSVDVPLGKNREALIKGENGGLKVPMRQEPFPGGRQKVRILLPSEGFKESWRPILRCIVP
ncbi:MAG: hypothetical protein V3R48_07365 [Thermoplasmata archaeon]